MTNLVDKNCKSTDWFTPPEILQPVRELFGGEIGLDPCTSWTNPTKANHTFFVDYTDLGNAWNRDGLQESWSDKGGVFCNPPYGSQLYSWIEKTVNEAAKGLKIVLLVSASSRWDQERWQKIFSPELTTMVIPRGRVKFLNAQGEKCKSPPYPSLLFFYNIDPDEINTYFKNIGAVVLVEIP